jgi:hypothetical protein
MWIHSSGSSRVDRRGSCVNVIYSRCSSGWFTLYNCDTVHGINNIKFLAMGLEVRCKHGKSALADSVCCSTSTGQRRRGRLSTSFASKHFTTTHTNTSVRLHTLVLSG